MNRFKVGDRVIVVRDASTCLYHDIGSVLTVKEVGKYSIPVGPQFNIKSRCLYFHEAQMGAYEIDLELEHIFNSPLYKALK